MPSLSGISLGSIVMRTALRIGSRALAARNAIAEPAVIERKVRRSIALSQPVEIELRVPGFLRSQQLIPRHFMSLINGRASQHRGERSFDTERGLILELAGLDALKERFVLFGIGLRKIVGELAGGAEFRGL